MPGPEGIVLGAGHDLPDASILQNFDFSAPSLPSSYGNSSTVWPLAEHPEAVLRLHRESPIDEEGCWQLAERGVRHLRELQDRGIPMPAQRFVVGPDQYRQRWARLYTIAERLPPGRELTYEPKDAEHAKIVIAGTAGYLLRRITHPDPEDTTFLYDTSYPWQYTILEGDEASTEGHKARKTQDFSIHDTGLEFADMHESDIAKTLRNLGVHLVRWANYVRFERPPALNELIQRVEPRQQRIIRIAKEIVRPSLRRPKVPQPN